MLIGLYLFLIAVCVVLDTSLSSCVIVTILVFLGWLFTYTYPKSKRSDAINLFCIISIGYVISALIISFNYLNGKHYIVYDVITYTPFLDLVRPDIDYADYINNCYFKLADNNAVHEVMVRYACILCNVYIGKATVAYLALLHSIFGVFASMFLHKSLLLFFESKKAFKYVLAFAFCSCFLFYSGVIIRDICITCFYSAAIYLVLSPFKNRNIVLVLLLSAICVGFRLYSGVFLLSFVGVLITKRLQTTHFKKVIIPIMVLMLLFVLGTGVLGNLLEQTKQEIEYYQELDAGRATDGLSYKLLALPPGIQQIALFLYSQIMPFPFYARLDGVSNLTQFYESLTNTIYPIWWFMVFYFFFIAYLLKGLYKRLSMDYNFLILLSFVFILVNTAHIDVRRMMPVYPIIYITYLIFKHKMLPYNESKNLYKNVVRVFIGLLGLYMIIKY